MTSPGPSRGVTPPLDLLSTSSYHHPPRSCSESPHLSPVQAGILHNPFNGAQTIVSQPGLTFGVILPQTQNFLLAEYDQVFCPSPQVFQGASSTSDKGPRLVLSSDLVRVRCAPSSLTDGEDNKVGSDVFSWASPLAPCDQQVPEDLQL